MNVIIVIALLLILGIIFTQYLLRYVYTYSITERGFRILFLGVPLYIIPFSNMREVREISMKEFYGMNPFISWRFGNRLWAKRALVIVKRVGWIKNIAVTPDNTKETLRLIQQSMSQEDR